mgnify:CR=1 FL=1
MLFTKSTPIQCRDTALALIFLLLLIWFFTGSPYLIYAAMGLLLLAMIAPAALDWPARLWFGLSHILGQAMSRVLLGAIYLIFLMPVALVRRMLGKDAMRFKLWRRGTGSGFVERDHLFRKEDLQNPF